MVSTRELILDKALELFSENGYEAVSVKQLASAVGIKAPSLYKHFPSKQDIFAALMSRLSEVYELSSVLSISNPGNRLSEYEKAASMTPDEIADMLCSQLKLVTTHPVIGRTRKLLTIEQFRNPSLCAETEKRQYKDIFDYNRGLICYLISKKILTDGDPDIMTLQFISPINIELQRVDRFPDILPEAMEMIHKHVVQFFGLYGKEHKNA